MKTIEDMLNALQRHSNVVGVLEYGSDHYEDAYQTGDVDLVVILAQHPSAVESLHFYVQQVPVDLNIVPLQELCDGHISNSFHRAAVRDGRLRYDATGDLERMLAVFQGPQADETCAPLSEHAKAFDRHGHGHVLDKVRGRLHTMPVFCHFLLNTNIFWLVGTYFRVRGLSFCGEKRALAYLQQHEPSIFELITAFYATVDLPDKVAMTQQLTEMILAPIGGRWRKDEILAFGAEEAQDLQTEGQRVYNELFRMADEHAV